MFDLLAGLYLRRALLDTPAPWRPFLPYFLILPLALSLFREVFVCDMWKDITVVDILVNRGPAKCDMAFLAVFLLAQEGTHGDRGIILAEYLFLDKLGDFKTIPDFEGAPFAASPS